MEKKNAMQTRAAKRNQRGTSERREEKNSMQTKSARMIGAGFVCDSSSLGSRERATKKGCALLMVVERDENIQTRFLRQEIFSCRQGK
jgi:hypothetical protein